MSGKAAVRMRKLLNGTGCYRLTGSGPADWETTAESEGFRLLEEELEALLCDLFPAGATEAGLDSWEAALYRERSAGSPGERRQVLDARLSVNPRRFTPEDGPALLRAAGVEGVLEETPQGLRVVVGKLLGVSAGSAEAWLDKLLPAHLLRIWDDSVTWTALDLYAPDFDTLDGLGLTWEEIEELTRAQLETLGQTE